MNTIALTKSALRKLNEEWERTSLLSSSSSSRPTLIDLDSKPNQSCDNEDISSLDLNEDNSSCTSEHNSTNSDVSYLDLNEIDEDSLLDGEEDGSVYETDRETERPSQGEQKPETQADPHTEVITYYFVTVSRLRSEAEYEVDVLEVIFTVLLGFVCWRL